MYESCKKRIGRFIKTFFQLDVWLGQRESGNEGGKKETLALNGPCNAQIANLLKDLLDARIQLAIGVLVSCVRIEVLLHLGHAGVRFRTEAELDLDQRFETGVEVWNTQIDQLWEFIEQLLIELFV